MSDRCCKRVPCHALRWALVGVLSAALLSVGLVVPALAEMAGDSTEIVVLGDQESAAEGLATEWSDPQEDDVSEAQSAIQGTSGQEGREDKSLEVVEEGIEVESPEDPTPDASAIKLYAQDGGSAGSGISFVDVTAATAHYEDIQWLAASGISEGWTLKNGNREFRPYISVTRADMAAFIYRFVDLTDNGRMDRSPEVGYYSTTFTDVRAGDEANHAGEVLWMASQGITTGFKMPNGSSQFRGTSPVARQDMAAFMQRTYLRAR